MCVEEMKNLNAVNQTPIRGSPVTAANSTQPDEMSTVDFTDSVCDLINTVEFNDVQVDDILKQLPVDKPGTCGRSTAYFGSRPYSYGRIHHDPCAYPQCGVFDSIFTKMKTVDSDFSPDKYTCLVTHYPDGNSYIPSHSDNETQIKTDSDIYTISVGATRTLRLTNKIGVTQEHDRQLTHGSLYQFIACLSSRDVNI